MLFVFFYLALILSGVLSYGVIYQRGWLYKCPNIPTSSNLWGRSSNNGGPCTTLNQVAKDSLCYGIIYLASFLFLVSIIKHGKRKYFSFLTNPKNNSFLWTFFLILYFVLPYLIIIEGQSTVKILSFLLLAIIRSMPLLSGLSLYFLSEQLNFEDAWWKIAFALNTLAAFLSVKFYLFFLALNILLLS